MLLASHFNLTLCYLNGTIEEIMVKMTQTFKFADRVTYVRKIMPLKLVLVEGKATLVHWLMYWSDFIKKN